MVASTVVLSLLAAFGGCSEGPGTAADSFQDVYESGVTFEAFMADASSRKKLWDSNYGEGVVPDDILTRAQALGATWRILAVAEDWCSDSVSTVPFLALLSEQAPNVELRIVDSEVGRSIMEAHLTPDGRPATPTVIVLDQAFEEVGCWVERPSVLQDWALENRVALGDEFGPQKMAWYREDAGRTTLEEVLAVLEAADRGERVCDTG